MRRADANPGWRFSGSCAHGVTLVTLAFLKKLFLTSRGFGCMLALQESEDLQ
ncbi:MAG: hypothetical protein KKI09_06630 [Spirochaetes bacterium]|nr:hypothetical protein [Spirochaetota bacterium]MBU0955085.1 hypothetical protein [Spirochaetota bacterium]